MTMTPLFPLGRVVATPGFMELLEDHHDSSIPGVLLHQHVTGDPGTLGSHDVEANKASVGNGTRVFSAYMVGTDTVWVITEGDRSVTTLLLPEEY